MDDVENVGVEQRGPAVRRAMPKSERSIEQQWKSNAVAAEKFAVERREDPRSSWLVDENESQPFDGPMRLHVTFDRGFVRRRLVLRSAGAEDGHVVPPSKVCDTVPTDGTFGALSWRQLVSTHEYLEARCAHGVVRALVGLLLRNVNVICLPHSTFGAGGALPLRGKRSSVVSFVLRAAYARKISNSLRSVRS